MQNRRSVKAWSVHLFALGVLMMIFLIALECQSQTPVDPLSLSGLSLQDASVTGQAQQSLSDYSLTVESPLVLVDVLVTDEDGNVLTGLAKDNFRLFDNGEPQVIASLVSTTASMTVVILLEYSSMGYNYFAYKSAEWSARFLHHLEENDWVALVTYDMKPTVQVDFTRSQPEIEHSAARPVVSAIS